MTKKTIEICVWEKYAGKHKTSCGHQARVVGRGWLYCPYCGHYIELSDKEYQRLYYQRNKEKHAAYYREYYKEHK